MTNTVSAVFYFSPRLNAYYDLKRPSVQPAVVHLIFSDDELRLVSRWDDEGYTKISTPTPFMEDAHAPGDEPSFLGTVDLYELSRGTTFRPEKRPRQVAAVGRHQDGRFAFIRIYDWLGGEPAPLAAQVKLIYTRGRGRGAFTHDVDLLMEAGSLADLEATRPEEATESSYATAAFISLDGSGYYNRPGDGGFAHWTNMHWVQAWMVYENATVTFDTDTNIRVSGFFQRKEDKTGNEWRFIAQPFLDGHLRFLTFVENPDPGVEGERVDRVAVLGIKADGQLGFLRIFDSLGNGYPDLRRGRLPVEFMTSYDPIEFGRYNRELVQEVGSPAALIDRHLVVPPHPDEDRQVATRR